MVVGDILAPGKPSKPMGSEETNGSAKSCKLTISTQGLAVTISEAEGKISHQKDDDSKGKYKGTSLNVIFVVGRSGKSEKKARISGDDCASQSGSEGSSNAGDDDKANNDEFPGMKKRSLDQIFADGTKAQRVSSANHQVWNSGDLLVATPLWSLNMSRREVVVSEKHIQQERETLHAKVEVLRRETSELIADLRTYSESCMQLSEENSSILLWQDPSYLCTSNTEKESVLYPRSCLSLSLSYHSD